MTKYIEEPQAVQTRLAAGTLGTSSVAFFVVAAAAPLLVMADVAPLAIGFGGVGAPSGYLIAGVTLAIFAAGFTAMTKYIHNAGAFYAYISRGLGPTAGIVAAVVALVSYNALEIGMFGALGGFAHITIGALTGLNVPWWVWALIGVALVWFLGSRSIHVGSQFLIAAHMLYSVSKSIIGSVAAILTDRGLLDPQALRGIPRPARRGAPPRPGPRLGSAHRRIRPTHALRLPAPAHPTAAPRRGIRVPLV
jgi:amino acid transporter